MIRRFSGCPILRVHLGYQIMVHGSSRYENLDMDHVIESQNLNSEFVLVV